MGSIHSIIAWLGACAFAAVLSACSDQAEISAETGGQSAELPQQPPLQAAAESDLVFARHEGAFKATHYDGATNCSSCHDGISDSSGRDVSINRAWSGSLMANSARDPYWVARVASELERHSAHAAKINDTCSRCHAPMANDTARKQGVAPTILGDQGMLHETSPFFDLAMDSVSCTLCHQIDDNGLLGTDASASGNFSVVEQMNRADRPAYGSYVDPVGAFMQASVQFNPQYGAHMSESSVCAVCHDLFTSTINASTGEFNEPAAGAGFPEQMIFTEWSNSDFAEAGEGSKSCQNCHMPEADGLVQIATRGSTLQRDGFSRHDFLGANTVMQSVLRDNRDTLGVSTSVDVFDQAIEKNRQFLSRAASIDLDTNVRSGTSLTSEVRVSNRVGHKLPSGFLSRRVFIHFLVTDADGKTVFESGRYNDDGSIEGAVSDGDYARYELHHDIIDSPDQVQVYEAVVADTNGNVTQSLLSAASYLKDNRLLPSGFDKLNAPVSVQVSGQAAADPDFLAASDLVTYQVELTGQGPWQVRAQLVYQPLAQPHLQELFSYDQLPEVAAFRRMIEASEFQFEVLAVTTGEVR